MVLIFNAISWSFFSDKKIINTDPGHVNVMEDYDVLVVGCGPAGISAAIFTGRSGLRTCVIGNPDKSQMHMAFNIQNYFGFPDGIDGPVLLSKGMLQAQRFGVVLVREEVVSADATEDANPVFKVKTSKGREVSGHSLIIATGVPIRLSGIKNEDMLTGKGVHYCVNCDGAFYKGKKLAIIGNGDHAAESAQEALSFTTDITILANSPEFNFSAESDRALTKFKIKTELGRIDKLKGEKWFEAVVFEDGREMKFDGVFMSCGIAGALDFAANLGLEIQDNILVVDESAQTSMKGVFAAGNCTGRCRQLAKNVGDGCNAGISAIKFLRSKDNYLDYVHRQEPSEEGPKGDLAKPPVAALKKKKLRIGWFTFSCCEDSTIVFTEMLNDYYDKWKDIIEFAHVRVLKNNNDLSNLDVAFVEGAIPTEKMANELREIRKNCKRLVAIGSCAVIGMPSAQRNDFDARKKREIQPIVDEFKYNEKVVPIKDVVQVDYSVPGCPMTESGFLDVLGKIAKEFGIDA